MKEYDAKTPYYVKLSFKSGFDQQTHIYTVSLKDAQRLGGALEVMRGRERQ